jgi:Rho GDP-dissociation inhibitor
VYVHNPLALRPTLTPLTVEPETAPSGMLGRGHYEAVSKFVDDDNHIHLQFKWSFDIKKDWK